MNSSDDGILWILTPETPLFEKYIPSQQRCSLLESNMGNKKDKNVVGTALVRGAVNDTAEVAASVASEAVGAAIGTGPLAPLLLLANVLSHVIPNPSYSSPPILSKKVIKGQTLSPTNFENAVTATSKGGPATASVAPIENLCTNRTLKEYPPYYLTATTQSTTIETQYINYKYQSGFFGISR